MGLNFSVKMTTFINIGINAAAREAIRGTSAKLRPETEFLGKPENEVKSKL